MPRLTIEFSKKVDKVLKDLAAEDNTTQVEIIRRALSLYNFAKQETAEEDLKLSITDEEDKILKDLIFQ